MPKHIQYQNTNILVTSLCRNCAYCVTIQSNRECEWDIFEPVKLEKSMLYTPIKFDCVYFMEK